MREQFDEIADATRSTRLATARACRQRQLERALARAEYVPIEKRAALVLTLAGARLGLATVALAVVDRG